MVLSAMLLLQVMDLSEGRRTTQITMQNTTARLANRLGHGPKQPRILEVVQQTVAYY
jgi:hypothetical protein